MVVRMHSALQVTVKCPEAHYIFVIQQEIEFFDKSRDGAVAMSYKQNHGETFQYVDSCA